MNADTRKYLELFASKGLAVSLLMAANILVARAAGPDDYAGWVMITAAATFIHSALVNWTHPATIRFGAAEWTSDGTLSRTLRSRVPLLGISLVLAAAALLPLPWRWLRTAYGLGAEQRWAVAIVFVAIWLAAEAQSTLQAIDRTRTQALIAPLSSSLAFAAVVLVSYLRPASLVFWAVVATSLPAVVLWGGAWIVLLPRLWSRTSLPGGTADHVRFSWPLIPWFIVGYGTIWCDHVILRAFRSQTELGWFGSAFQVVQGVISANAVVTTLLVPRLVARSVTERSTDRRFVMNVAPTLFSLWAVFSLPLIAVLPAAFVFFMGKGFVEGAGMVAVLSVVVPTSVMTFLYTGLFNLQRRLPVSLGYAVLMLMVNVSASLYLTPRIGAYGASIATVLGLVTGQLLSVWDQHRFVKVPIGAAAVPMMAALALAATQALLGPALLPRLIWAAAASSAFVVVVRRTNAVSSSVLTRLFGPGSFLQRFLATLLIRRGAVAGTLT